MPASLFQLRNGFAAPRRPTRNRSVQTDDAEDSIIADDEQAIIADDRADDIRRLLIRKYADGSWTATDLSELACHFVGAGLPMFSDMALNPAALRHSGNSSRQIQAALDIGSIRSSLPKAMLPIISAGGRREFVPVACAWLSDVLTEEFLKEPETFVHLAQGLQLPAWVDNVARQKAAAMGFEAIPYGIFFDGAAWRGKGAGGRESVLNGFCSLWGSLTRRTLISIRKDYFCGAEVGCPCRGRCTTTALDLYISEAGFWASEGILPMTCLGYPWPSSKSRENLGQPFCVWKSKRVVFILIEIRSDWDQVSNGCGFAKPKQWRFCPECKCTQKEAFTAQGGLFPAWTHEEYMNAINASTIMVLLSWADVESIFQCLILDPRQVHGRVIGVRSLKVFCLLRKEIVVLQKWDRLEVGGSCRDILGGLSDLRGGWPFRFFFWRRRPDIHNFSFFSPLMAMPGVRRESIVLDVLHGIDLGPTSRIAGIALAKIVRSGIFGNDNTEEGLRGGTRQLTTEAKKWYKREKVKTRIHRFTPGADLAVFKQSFGECLVE